MSTPLFVRTPVIGLDLYGPILGSAASAVLTASWWKLCYRVVEPTIIERLTWAGNDYRAGTGGGASMAGKIVLAVSDDTDGDTEKHVVTSQSVSVGAWDAAAWPCGEIDLVALLGQGINLPPGWSLYVAHDVANNVATFAQLDIIAHGGVLR